MYWTSEVTLVIVLSLLSIRTLGQDISQHEFTTVSTESDHSKLVDSLNGFGYRVMLKILESNGMSNVVMSPVGINVLMAMTLLGSAGNTYNELADMLGFSHDILENRKHHEDFGQMLSALNDSSTQTVLANAVFVDQGIHLRELYQDYLSRVYNGGALNAEFADGGSAKQTINEWVEAQTKGKIDNFLRDSPPSSTKVVLLNALYYKGQWAKPFLAHRTKNMTFHAPTKSVISKFMLNHGNFHYISSGDGLEMIALPYNDSVTTMYVLKPLIPKEKSLFELLKTLDFVKIESLIKRMSSEKCVVKFPKMNIKSNLNLEKFIKLLGAPSMFNSAEANFALMVKDSSGISNGTEVDLMTKIKDGDSSNFQDLLEKLPNPQIHVDSITQEVKINIDEFGTEATAATSGLLARSANLFYADTPFLMFIRNAKTKLITFLAVIFDPNGLIVNTN